MLAETDYVRYTLEDKMYNEHERNLMKSCALFSNQLRILASFDEMFYITSDFNGNKLIVYSKNNVLYIPSCLEINTFSIKHTNTCYIDLPVNVEINNKYISLFLTKNNFLKGFSKEVHCSLINDRFILTSEKLSIVRVGTEIKIFNLSNVIEREIHLDHYNLSSLNFFHHKEITNGFDNSKYFEEQNNINDANWNFYILPNDEINTSSKLLSDLVISKLQFVDELRRIKQMFNLALIIIITLILFILLPFVFFKFFNLSKRQSRTPQILPLEELASLLVGRSS
ncbi:unnamed protein product [Brachionus calyciflorus]|uniref:Uncharacterized protein n=1 Tax=Brachionus calyciflorus TaxID=104777 RepID=A0A814KGF2_9BILA|nr:unnamed protein product [Brachionus calyciflorus]